MLPRKNRVPTPLFSQVGRMGELLHSPSLSLKVVPGVPSDPSRIAFVVSGKVAKTAVLRNKLKRRARYIVNKQINSLKPGKIAICYFKPGSNKLDFSSLEGELTLLLKRAHVI
jgi:ribonuclease P protein component